MMSADYDYPDEIDDLNRRERRRAKRDWRKEDQAERTAWLRDQRRSEPASPAGLIAVAALLAIIVLGVGGGLPRLIGGGDKSGDESGGTTPSSSLPSGSAEPSVPVDPTSQASSESPVVPQSLPVVTQRPSAAVVATADQVVASWARMFYTRNPATERFEQLVYRAAQFTTDDVAAGFLAAGDSTYEALRTDKGTSRVVSAPVTPPRPGTAPVDTPARISRLVTITIDVTGKRPGRLTVPLLVTVGQQSGRWVISAVTGGTGT